MDELSAAEAALVAARSRFLDAGEEWGSHQTLIASFRVGGAAGPSTLALRSRVLEGARNYFIALKRERDVRAKRALVADGGASEVLGVVMCVGITFLMFGVALAMATSFCPGCKTSYDGDFDGDPWEYCEGHEFEKPACDDGAPVFSEVSAGVEWCRLGVTRHVEGYALIATEGLICVSVAGPNGA